MITDQVVKGDWEKTCGVSEEEESSCFTFLTFHWVSPMLSRGYERVKNQTMLLDSDLLGLPKELDASENYTKFAKEYEVEKELAAATNKATEERIRSKCAADAAKKGEEEDLELTAEEVEKAMRPPNTFAALHRSLGGSAKIGAVFRLIADITGLGVPFLIQAFIRWMGDYSEANSTTELWVGFVLGFSLATCQFIYTSFTGFSAHFTLRSFLMARDVLTVAIYEKAMKLDATHKLAGKIVTMHSTDTFKLIEMGVFFHGLWASPIVIVAALIGLYYFIGPAGLLSLAVMIILTPVQGMVAKKLMSLRGAINAATDERMKAVRELLMGIRIIKFMNWEKELERKIQEKRENEIRNFKPLFIQRSILITMIGFVPQVVMFTVFASAYGFGRDINSETVFPVIAMLNILRLPLAFLPMAIGKWVDTSVSLSRIGDFLAVPEREDFVMPLDWCPPAAEGEEETAEPKKKDNGVPAAVVITRADLQVLNENDHSQRVTLLYNVNVRIPKDKLTIIVGATGAGKSTLMNAISGEGLIAPGGHIQREGDIALVTQEAWIMNASVRNNILMGRPYDETLYLDTVNHCQLMADFDNLAASDMTEIGERGINLSGGQKQRIAFARAVYSGIGLVLMDDPLSAVDAHVRQALFEDVIQGQLAGRTRVLVTHYVEYLQEADNIIIVQDRKIVFEGSWEELNTQNDIDLAELTEQAQTPGASPGGRSGALATAGAGSPGGTQRQAELLKNKDARVKLFRDEIPQQKKGEGSEKLIDEEGQAVGIIKGRVYAWYFGFAGCGPVSLAILLFTSWRGMTLISDSMISYWATRTDVGDWSFSENQYLIIYGCSVSLCLILICVRQIPYVYAIVRIASQTHSVLVRRVIRAPMSVFDTTPLGRIINRFSKDMEAMDLVIPELMNFFLQMVMVMVGAAVLMIVGVYFVAIILLVLVIIFATLVRFYSATNRALKRIDGVNRSPVLAIMAESMGGVTTLRAYDIVSTFSKVHTNKVLASSRSTNAWVCAQRWLTLRADCVTFCSNLSMAYIIIGLLSWYDQQQRDDNFAVMALGLTTSVAVGGAMSFLATMSADLEAAMSSIERVQEYAEDLEQEKEVVYGQDNVPELPPNWPTTGSIDLKGVSLRYRDGLPLVLEDVSVKFPAGEKIGVVGRTGAGKSTIMLALFRIVELAQGTIHIDGHDISNLQLDDLRSQITIIPQDPLLFEGTIKSNLDPFDVHEEGAIKDALRTVGLYEVVVEKVTAAAAAPKGSSTRNSASAKNEPIDGVIMVEGIDDDEGNGEDIDALTCAVDERGGNFSVGQRQLLCLARAMMKKSKILLLDEATASVDFESDELIQSTVRREFSNCTILTIAHRLATVMDYDKILVLDKGRVAEFDHPRNLLANKEGVFYSMVASQGDEQFEILKSKTTAPQTAAKPASNEPVS